MTLTTKEKVVPPTRILSTNTESQIPILTSLLGITIRKKITYISIGDKTKTVTLTFAKDDNGQLLLVQKHAVGLGLEKKQATKRF